MRLGINRAVEDQPSGRAFLQEIGATLDDVPACSSFFETLPSPRRLRLRREVLDLVRARMGRSLND